MSRSHWSGGGQTQHLEAGLEHLAEPLGLARDLREARRERVAAHDLERDDDERAALWRIGAGAAAARAARHTGAMTRSAAAAQGAVARGDAQGSGR